MHKGLAGPVTGGGVVGGAKALPYSIVLLKKICIVVSHNCLRTCDVHRKVRSGSGRRFKNRIMMVF